MKTTTLPTADRIATWTNEDLLEEYEGTLAHMCEYDDGEEGPPESLEAYYSRLSGEKRRRGI